MAKGQDICLVCLCTDKPLKTIDTKLSDFHDELCDFSVPEYDARYCLECEYLLKKSYKFKVRCSEALEIFNSWKKSKGMDKTPITDLCTLLPSSALSLWSPDNSQIYSFICEEIPNRGSELMMTVESLQIEQSSTHGTGDVEELSDNQITRQSVPEGCIKVEQDESRNRLTEGEKTLKDFLIFKNEDTNTFEEILLKSDIDRSNSVNEYVNKLSDDKANDDLNDFSFSDDDDYKLIYLKNKVSKRNGEKRKKSTRKRSFGKESHTEDENSSEDGKRRKSGVNKEDCGDRSEAKKDNDKQNITKKKDVNEDGKVIRFHTRRAIIAELRSMLDSETKDENCAPMLNLCKKRPFSKERLKDEIKSKFASCGELRTTDGTVIDKEFILDCLDDKVTEYVLRQLYQAVYRKSSIKPKALKLFKCIQNKYKNEYDSVFDIEYLNTKEKMLEEFEKRRCYASYVAAEFKCEICYQGFKHEKKLQYHKRCHDESAGDMICSICKARHRSMKSLTNHMNAHEAVYRCKLCPLITYYKSSMQNHYQQHKGVKYTCKQCCAVFGSVSAFRTHVSYRHARGHACTACGCAFSTRVGLRAHLTRNHQNEALDADGATSVRCDKCALSFASVEAFQKHSRVTHKVYGVRGRPPGTIVTRNESRPRRRPVMTCRVCNAVGSSWGWLSLHCSLEHPTADLALLYADKHTYLCDVCGKSFSTIYTLQAHLNVHSGSRPFSCDSCSASFHRALSLKLHRLVHTPPSKPCGTCGKKFRSTSNLYNHMRSHIGDRRYKCDICGKGFIHRCSLNEHIRGVHKNIRRVRKRGVIDAAERGH